MRTNCLFVKCRMQHDLAQIDSAFRIRTTGTVVQKGVKSQPRHEWFHVFRNQNPKSSDSGLVMVRKQFDQLSLVRGVEKLNGSSWRNRRGGAVGRCG